MPDQRQYTEEQIAAIFEAAARAQSAAQNRSASGGLTLAELQQIGATAGIGPGFIEDAARAVAHRPHTLPRTTYLGLPIGVGRTVELPGPLTEDEWERLVVDLRETFQARGKVRTEGTLREWSNGNLQALVEPTDTGHRLRLRTLKGNASLNVGVGLFNLGIALVIAVMMLGTGTFEPTMVAFTSLLVVTAALGLGTSAYSLPRWAEEREQQMEALATRAVQRLAADRSGAASLGTPPVAATEQPAPRLGLDAEEAATEAARIAARRTRS